MEKRRKRRPSQRGIFISFEGTEGAGKTTLIREVESQLSALQIRNSIILTREPGGTPLAEEIRRLILANPMDPWTEIFLYEAARATHVSEKILPALQSGSIVLCDRFTDSTLAYQAFTRGLGWKEVKRLNHLATQKLSPDLTVLLDIDPAIGLARARDKNRFEEEGIQFQQKVRRGFLKSRSEAPQRWLTLRVASASPADLARKVIRQIERRYGSRIQYQGARSFDG